MNILATNRMTGGLIVFLIAILVNIIPTQAQTGDNQLKAMSDEVNQMCPIDMGMLGTMSSTEYLPVSKTFVYNFNIDPTLVTLEQLAASGTSVMKHNMQTTLSQTAYHPFLQILVGADARLCAKFHQDQKNPITIMISTDELREMLSTKRTDRSLARESVENTVAMENSRYPQNLGNGMLMTKAYCNGNQVVYECQIDPSILTAADIAASEQMIKDAMINLMASDLGMNAFCKNVVAADYSIRYHYYEPGTNRYHDIIITAEDLAKII